MKQLLIVGGGAAGMAAALTAAQNAPEVRVTILEGMPRAGKKILATGNGKCNLSNETIVPDAYHTCAPERLAPLLEQMPVSMAVDFFNRLGLMCTADSAGRIYPYCRQASMVLDLLLLGLRRRNIAVITDCKVTQVTAQGRRFTAHAEDGRTFSGDAVLLSTGGKAAPKQGSTGIGYAIAKGFGHSCTPLRPCLVGLQCKGSVFKQLKGIRANAAIRLYHGKARLGAEFGELQFTDYGISGIPAMQLSCLLPEQGAEVAVDFFPQQNFDELRQLLRRKCRSFPGEPLEDAMLGLIHKRLQFAVLKTLNLSPAMGAGSLSRADLDRLTAALKGWRFPVTGTLSWDHAQVTGGGIPLHELTPDFQSKRQPGLYLAGELLDVAGNCGGYNLHWAWCSGILAGRAAARFLQGGSARPRKGSGNDSPHF